MVTTSANATLAKCDAVHDASNGAPPFRDRLAAALDGTPRTAVELAQALGVDRTQVHHAMKALETAGVAVQVPGRPMRWRRA